MAKILSKFGEQQLVMVNYACGLNQSETGKYFEWIIANEPAERRREAGGAAALESRVRELILVQGDEMWGNVRVTSSVIVY